MSQPDQKGCYSEMPAVVKQRQEPRKQTAQRTDDQDNVKQQERASPEPADQQRFDGGIRVNHRPQTNKQSEINSDASEHHRIVNPLLAVPTDSAIGMAHCGAPFAREPGADSSAGA